MQVTLTRLAPGRSRRPPAAFETYDVDDVSADMSFLELFDVLNERLIGKGEEPVAFDHDCREGICGSCSMMINGRAARTRARHRDLPAPHAQVRGRRRRSRSSRGGPRRSRSSATSSSTASAFDRIVEAGGYITAPTGSAPDAQPDPRAEGGVRRRDGRRRVHRLRRVRGRVPERRGQLFTAAKVMHLNLLPQGQPERWDAGHQHGRTRWRTTSGPAPTTASARRRARRRSASTSSRCMNRDYIKAQFKQRRLASQRG